MRQHRNDILSRNFAQALLRARGDRSQAEFARILGIPSQQTYQRYEKGLIPTGDVLHRIASRLSVSVDVLLNGGGAVEKPAVVEPVDGVRSPDSEMLKKHAAVVMALVARNLDAGQKWKIVQDILESRFISDDSKLFWIKLLGGDSKGTAITNLDPAQQQALIQEHTRRAALKESEALKKHFESRAQADGLIVLAADELTVAAQAGVPVKSMRLAGAAGQPPRALSKDIKEYLDWWARWNRGETGVSVIPPEIRSDGSVSEAAMKEFRQQMAQLASEWPFDAPPSGVALNDAPARPMVGAVLPKSGLGKS